MYRRSRLFYMHKLILFLEQDLIHKLILNY